MENSKYYLSQLKFLVFTAAIILGIYLAINEILDGNSFKNFLVFFFASVLIYLIEFSIIQQEAFLNHQPKLNLANKKYRGKILFHFLFLPIANMSLLLITGLLQTSWTTFFTSAFVLGVSLILLLNHAREISLNHVNVRDDMGLGPDIQKLVFIFFSTIVAYSVLKNIDSPASQITVYNLYLVLVFLISFTIFLYRGYSKNDIFLNSIATGYVSMLLLVMIGILTLFKIEVAVGAYITLIYYININLTDIYTETDKLDTSVLGKYLSMVILATALLVLA
ncbi:hypothetical protein KC678_04735 [Candidatus Dojkabacteria bacterium]|uniref:Uncharacterized protein n=1 Tax=Candidatus Dojkabacteria bacterium TaxID=2099670 RepID=A0A955L261_9BACT|nr:hypothetical protein [Candidatus Dojkabacteria bacterium]